MKLYDYFRSSGAYRVRIALNLKGLEYESKVVHLAHNEQFAPRVRGPEPAIADTGTARRRHHADPVDGDYRVS